MPVAVSAISLTSCNTNQDKKTIALSQVGSPGLTSDSGPPQFTTGVGCYKESRREQRVSWRRTWKLHRTVEPMRWSAFWGSFSKTLLKRTRRSLTADVNCLDKSGKLLDRTLAKQEQVRLLAKNFVSGPGLEDVLGCNMPPYARVLDAQKVVLYLFDIFLKKPEWLVTPSLTTTVVLEQLLATLFTIVFLVWVSPKFCGL